MANIVPAVIATSTVIVGRIFSGRENPKLGRTGRAPELKA